jgi:hypothetical protein
MSILYIALPSARLYINLIGREHKKYKINAFYCKKCRAGQTAGQQAGYEAGRSLTGTIALYLLRLRRYKATQYYT